MFPSSTCGIAAPSLAVKSRLTGSRTSPIVMLWLAPDPPVPPEGDGVVEEPAEQAASMREVAATAVASRAERVNVTMSPPWMSSGRFGAPHQHVVCLILPGCAMLDIGGS